MSAVGVGIGTYQPTAEEEFHASHTPPAPGTARAEAALLAAAADADADYTPGDGAMAAEPLLQRAQRALWSAAAWVHDQLSLPPPPEPENVRSSSSSANGATEGAFDGHAFGGLHFGNDDDDDYGDEHCHYIDGSNEHGNDVDNNNDAAADALRPRWRHRRGSASVSRSMSLAAADAVDLGYMDDDEDAELLSAARLRPSRRGSRSETLTVPVSPYSQSVSVAAAAAGAVPRRLSFNGGQSGEPSREADIDNDNIDGTYNAPNRGSVSAVPVAHRSLPLPPPRARSPAPVDNAAQSQAQAQAQDQRRVQQLQQLEQQQQQQEQQQRQQRAQQRSPWVAYAGDSDADLSADPDSGIGSATAAAVASAAGALGSPGGSVGAKTRSLRRASVTNDANTAAAAAAAADAAADAASSVRRVMGGGSGGGGLAGADAVQVLAATAGSEGPVGPVYGEGVRADPAAAAAATAVRFDLDAAVSAVLQERAPGTAVDALKITRYRYKPQRDAARDLFTLVGLLENFAQVLFRAPGNRHDMAKQAVSRRLSTIVRCLQTTCDMSLISQLNSINSRFIFMDFIFFVFNIICRT